MPTNTSYGVMQRGLFDYAQPDSAVTNLRALADVIDINNITTAANGILLKSGLEDATKRARYIEYFYDKMLLDTLALGSENNVFLKYCQTKEVPEGHAKFLLRRWGGLTEHTVPLVEGVPPKSDMTASESFEGTYSQYGRYMEFTDTVDYTLIDPVIAHYTTVYGDLAIRTAERLCRQEAINFGSKIYANGAGLDTMVIGDTVGIADYRALALKLKRILVKPINGVYKVICSPEHLYDLVQDPLVVAYMTYTNTAEPFKTGKPVELFSISFEETMLDEYAYNYTGDSTETIDHPGEFKDGSTYKLRVYTIIDGVEYYYNIAAGENDWNDGTNNRSFREVRNARLADGSYIPAKVFWYANKAIEAMTTATTGVTLRDGTPVVIDEELLEKFQDPANTWYELPVHKSFMFGQEFMVKTGISGRTGAKFYVKPKGSAGVLDPIDQRQSIGFKIDTLGFNLLRSEAIHVFYFVPTQAAAVQQYAITHKQTWDQAFVQELDLVE